MKQFIALLTIAYASCHSLMGMEETSSKKRLVDQMHLIAQNVRTCSCLIKFDTNHDLIKHIKSNHYNPKNKRYFCFFDKYCPLTSKSPEDIILHFPSHTEEPIFKCELCNKTECFSIQIRTHLRLHDKYTPEFKYLAEFKCKLQHDKKTYDCPECKIKCKFLGNLLKHVRTKHLSEKLALSRNFNKTPLRDIAPKPNAPENRSVNSLESLIRATLLFKPEVNSSSPRQQSQSQPENNTVPPAILEPAHHYSERSNKCLMNEDFTVYTLPPFREEKPEIETNVETERYTRKLPRLLYNSTESNNKKDDTNPKQLKSSILCITKDSNTINRNPYISKKRKYID